MAGGEWRRSAGAFPPSSSPQVFVPGVHAGELACATVGFLLAEELCAGGLAFAGSQLGLGHREPPPLAAAAMEHLRPPATRTRCGSPGGFIFRHGAGLLVEYATGRGR